VSEDRAGTQAVPDVLAAEGPVLKTVPNVPIVSTGTYHLAGNPYPGGETTFTSEDLADAVAAVQDPAVKLPRLKLGHTSEWGDAEPCFGKVDNLRIGDNGQTIYGDYVGTPAWLAQVLPAIYPNRSIEANFNVTTATGNTYRMVITAVALLGVQLPGVATLEDLAGLYTETMPEGTEIEGESESAVVAELGDSMRFKIRGREAKGSVNLEDLRRSFYDNVAVGDQYYWWIREVFLDPNELIVDNDDGELYRMSFTISGEDVEFGDPEPVKVQYAAASLDKPLARTERAEAFASRSESRPETTDQEERMDKVRERLGLPADATEEDILKALDEQESSTPPSTQEPGESEGNPAEQGPETGTPSPQTEGDDNGEGAEQPEAEAEPVAASNGGNGTVTVDAATLAEMQRQAALGAQAHARQTEEERETTLSACVKDGVFPPARLDHWRTQWNNDPEGTKETLAGMPKGLIPVEARGGAQGEGSLSATEYDQSWLTESERARAAGVPMHEAGRVIQEA
jgi:hypothetical protein